MSSGSARRMPARRGAGDAGSARHAVGIGQADQRAAVGVAALPRRRSRRPAPTRRRRPAPCSGSSALASLSLHLARSTNIDRRFSVGRAAGRREQASRISSAPRCQTMKLACRRPLAEQKPARRALRRGRARRCRWSAGRAGSSRRRRRGRGSRPSASARRHRSSVGGRVHAPIIISRHDLASLRGLRGRAGSACGSMKWLRSRLVAAGRARRAAAAAPPPGGCNQPLRAGRPTRSSCRSSPAPRRATSRRAGCRPACRRRRWLLYEWFRWSGQAAQDPRRQLRDRPPARRRSRCSTRWCAATRRWPPCA